MKSSSVYQTLFPDIRTETKTDISLARTVRGLSQIFKLIVSTSEKILCVCVSIISPHGTCVA